MIFGRPFSIPYGQFSNYQDMLPQQIDDEYIMKGHEQPPNHNSINAFFRHIIRLHHVMDDALLRLRETKSAAYYESINGSCDTGIRRPISGVNAAISLLTTILQLDGHLLSWQEYLPDYLKTNSINSECTSKLMRGVRRQAYVLHGRFLALRILLHRQTVLFLLQPVDRRSWPQAGIQEWPPIFSDCYNDSPVGVSTKFREGRAPSSVETALARTSAEICISSAMEQIEMIDLPSSKAFPREGWWWDFNCEALIWFPRSEIC